MLRLRRLLLKTFVPELVWPRTVVVGGVSIQLRGAPYSFGVKRLLKREPDKYEGPERHFIADLAEGDRVLEYGGSIGIVTALISERIGSTGRIVSIEADQDLTSYSKTWLEARGNIEVATAYAFPLYQRISLEVSFDNSSGSLGGTVAFQEADADSKQRDFDSCFFIVDAEKSHSMKPNVLFIDIEGAEIIMLEHPPEIPVYVEKIVIELHPSVYGEDVETRLVKRLLDEGFVQSGHLGTVYQFLRTVSA